MTDEEIIERVLKDEYDNEESNFYQYHAKDVVGMFYGFEGTKYSIAEIAAKLELHEEVVKYLIKMSKIRAKHPARMNKYK